MIRRFELGRGHVADRFRRRGRIQEIADISLYLASDKGSYITGQTIPINGGMVFV